MKKTTTVVLHMLVSLTFFVSSCVSGSTPTTTPIPPTFTPPPLTATATPTATAAPSPTPTLPDTIEYKFDKSISEEAQTLVLETVNQAYWYYVSIGCSPVPFKASFYNGEAGNSDYLNGEILVSAGVANIEMDPTKAVHAISHELAHVMCQHAFTQRQNLGSLDLRWLTEAVANYFSAMERITNVGSNFGARTIHEMETGGLPNHGNGQCTINPAMLEASNAHLVYPDDFNFVGEAATILLVKTTPDGIVAVTNYYKLLSKGNPFAAFEAAFGRSTKEFYQQYQDECSKGFPAISK
jgi:hypothetical protein